MDEFNYVKANEYITHDLFHSVHTSERKAFRACRRRWNWRYNQWYHPTTTPKPLEFGTAIHKGFEVWYDPDMWLKDREVQSALAIGAFSKVIKDQLNAYRELNGEPDQEVLNDYHERVTLGVNMLKYYTERVSPLLDVDLTPLATEIPFEVPLGFNCKCDGCWDKWWASDQTKPIISDSIDGFAVRNGTYRTSKWEGLPVTFGGKIDAIMQDRESRILCVDWKSAAKMIDDETEAAFLELDDQVGGYPAALYKSGRACHGFVYHEQKKAVPGPPKLLSRAYKGKLFSTDKTANVEWETFYKTVKKEDSGAFYAGLYDEHLAFLKSPMAPRFYQRYRVYKSDIQMENFWKDLIAEAKDMLENPRIYPQPSRFSCNSCLYRQPCDGQNRGEDFTYTLDSMYIKKDPHDY